MFHIFGRFDGVIEVFEEKGQAKSEEEANHGGEKEVEAFIGFEGFGRQFGPVDYLDVAGGNPCRNSGFLHPLEQSIIEIPVGIGLALEDIILDGLLLHLHGLDLLAFEGLPEEGFPPETRLIVVLDATDDPAHLDVEALLDGIHLILEADHLRVFGLECFQPPHVLGIELDVGLFQLLNEIVLQDRGKGIVASIPGLLIQGLLGNPVRFGLGQGLVQFGEALHCDILFLLQGDDVVFRGKFLQVLISPLNLGFEHFQLSGQPFLGLFRRNKPGLQVLLNVFRGQGIGYPAREFGILGIEVDFHETGIPHGLDLELTEKRVDKGGLPVGLG